MFVQIKDLSMFLFKYGDFYHYSNKLVSLL